MIFASAKNLIILISKSGNRYDPADFVDIGNRAAAFATDVRVYVVSNEVPSSSLPKSIWEFPTLTVAFNNKLTFIPPRGRIIHNRKIEKLEQARILRLAGIPIPHCEIFRPGMTLNPAIWGDVVLLKPAPLDATSHGDNIHIFRRSSLAAMKAGDFPPDHFVHRFPMIIQQFIDTGKFPCKYRVLTLCGEVLYAQFRKLMEPRPDLALSDEVLKSAQVATSGGSCQYFHEDYPDVVEFAKKVACAFPNVPLLGVDIVRDFTSNELYVLEVNAGGNTWHFSSKMWAERRRQYPKVAEEAKTQYNAFDAAARALVGATRRWAS
ncbi:MAG: hypothetical protein Q8L53_19105 [Aestuariivirga sp.]|nr:hypothetical protein [Aestuariivirga sp.]